jgi:Flp pilus assembly protein TadG
MRFRRNYRAPRDGVAAAELAILLPFLAFLLSTGVDFARVFYHAQVVMNCARNGAIYASFSPQNAADKQGIADAVKRDAADIGADPKQPLSKSIFDPNKDVATGTDALGNPFVRVTVHYPFTTVTLVPGIPRPMIVSRTVEMRISPKQPAPK